MQPQEYESQAEFGAVTRIGREPILRRIRDTETRSKQDGVNVYIEISRLSINVYVEISRLSVNVCIEISRLSVNVYQYPGRGYNTLEVNFQFKEY